MGDGSGAGRHSDYHYSHRYFTLQKVSMTAATADTARTHTGYFWSDAQNKMMKTSIVNHIRLRKILKTLFLQAHFIFY